MDALAGGGTAYEIIGICLFLAALFVTLGLWQRKIGRARTAKAVEEIREADALSTRRPVSQHPQVDPLRCIGCASCVAACPEEGVLGLVDGIARILHGIRCIGHARCAEACPVGALVVGMGDISSRPDIPVLSESLESTVPGVYLAGEVGGAALIRHAIEQGARAVEDIARKVRGETGRGREWPGEQSVADVLIVGAGPAGISATLKAVERGLSYVTIDQEEIGGTVRKYPRRKLALTQPVDIPLYGRMKRSAYLKEELIELWEGIIRDFRLEIRPRVKLLGVERQGGLFVAKTSAGIARCRHVVLALGRRGTPRKLGVPGEESEKVFYQLIDAATYTHQRVLVVGGGDSAIEAATALANQPGNTVTLSYRRSEFVRIKKRNEERIHEYLRQERIRAIFRSNVKRIHADSAVLALGEGEEVERELRIPNDHVFVFAGGDPPYPLLREIGVRFGTDGATAEVRAQGKTEIARAASRVEREGVAQ